MRRIASHFVFWKKCYRMHCLELDESGHFLSISPFTEETAGTEFYPGLLVPVISPPDFLLASFFSFPYKGTQPADLIAFLGAELERRSVSEGVEPCRKVTVFLLHGLTLAASEFGTDNGCCNGYIKRL